MWFMLGFRYRRCIRIMVVHQERSCWYSPRIIWTTISWLFKRHLLRLSRWLAIQSIRIRWSQRFMLWNRLWSIHRSWWYLQRFTMHSSPQTWCITRLLKRIRWTWYLTSLTRWSSISISRSRYLRLPILPQRCIRFTIVWFTNWSRHLSNRLWYLERQKLLERQELMGCRLGWQRLHQDCSWQENVCNWSRTNSTNTILNGCDNLVLKALLSLLLI